MYDTWEELKQNIANCSQCKLHKGRKNIVFGTGNPHASILFIGEGPGGEEDIQGEPFVGKAGQLMDKAFEALEIDRKSVYIANVVKCRPPQNRNPEKDEIDACMDYLRNQVMLLQPKIIVLLGSVALQVNVVPLTCNVDGNSFKTSLIYARFPIPPPKTKMDIAIK